MESDDLFSLALLYRGVLDLADKKADLSGHLSAFQDLVSNLDAPYANLLTDLANVDIRSAIAALIGLGEARIRLDFKDQFAKEAREATRQTSLGKYL